MKPHPMKILVLVAKSSSKLDFSLAYSYLRSMKVVCDNRTEL